MGSVWSIDPQKINSGLSTKRHFNSSFNVILGLVLKGHVQEQLMSYGWLKVVMDEFLSLFLMRRLWRCEICTSIILMILVWIYNSKVRRVLIDGDSSIDVIFLDTYRRIGLMKEMIESDCWFWWSLFVSSQKYSLTNDCSRKE